ncbi:DUF4905 domain-containing protein [Pedobacter sp. BS3]|uniref:DUF4905 domain-containing protein n=1 Tax=Pedobacter sp. BS3 TaxID=2567937 RepID=UPI0011EEE617|nr:DUF4905 domain-containing protein [Pedobacter sp. BS3]
MFVVMLPLIQQTLKQTFSSLIWKLEIDEQHQHIAIETRDTGIHTAQFSLLNYSTGKVLFKDLALENNWWLGLDKAHHGLVFLHGYISQDSPQHRGIICLNAQGQIQWQQFNIALYDVYDKGLLVYDTAIQPRKLYTISADAGQRNQDTAPAATPTGLVFPQIHQGELPGYIPGTVSGPVLTAMYNEKSIWAYHTRQNGRLSQELIIYGDGKILLHDKLGSDIQKPNPEAFFLQKNHLFCIRNKNEIVSYLV